MGKQKEKGLNVFFQKLLVMGLFLLFASVTYAQNKLTGTVVDATGEPIIGASVVVEGGGIWAWNSHRP